MDVDLVDSVRDTGEEKARLSEKGIPKPNNYNPCRGRSVRPNASTMDSDAFLCSFSP